MLAECNVARKAAAMLRALALLLVPALLLAPAACGPQPQGPLKATVIGAEPKLRDPALGPLPPSDAILLENVAQGLVRFDATGKRLVRTAWIAIGWDEEHGADVEWDEAGQITRPWRESRDHGN